MRFLADECCDTDLVVALRQHSHDVVFVAELMPGSVDDDVLALAFSQNRILITEDKDFGELAFRLAKPSRGIVLLRFDVSERQLKAGRVIDLVTSHSGRLEGSFVVLEAHKIRIRPLR